MFNGSVSCAIAMLACIGLGACGAANDSPDLESNVVTPPRRTTGSAGADDDALDGGQATSPDQTDGATNVVGSERCDPTKPFEAPVLVPVVNGASHDEGARLSPDELTIYFSSERNGGSDVFVATRATASADFAAPVPLPGSVNTTAEERFPSVRGDGLALYVKRRTGGDGEVSVATRATSTAPFGALTIVTALSAGSDDGNPFIRDDGAVIYFGTTRSGGTDIYRAKANPAGGFDAPSPVSEINSNDNDTSPVVTPDELTIYFASARAGGDGLRDIYVAHRKDASMPFGAPQRIAELASSSDDMPTWASADHCRLYFSSNRPGGLGGFDVYLAKRSR